MVNEKQLTVNKELNLREVMQMKSFASAIINYYNLSSRKVRIDSNYINYVTNNKYRKILTNKIALHLMNAMIVTDIDGIYQNKIKFPSMLKNDITVINSKTETFVTVNKSHKLEKEHAVQVIVGQHVKKNQILAHLKGKSFYEHVGAIHSRLEGEVIKISNNEIVVRNKLSLDEYDGFKLIGYNLTKTTTKLQLGRFNYIKMKNVVNENKLTKRKITNFLKKLFKNCKFVLIDDLLEKAKVNMPKIHLIDQAYSSLKRNSHEFVNDMTERLFDVLLNNQPKEKSIIYGFIKDNKTNIVYLTIFGISERFLGEQIAGYETKINSLSINQRTGKFHKGINISQFAKPFVKDLFTDEENFLKALEFSDLVLIDAESYIEESKRFFKENVNKKVIK